MSPPALGLQERLFAPQQKFSDCDVGGILMLLKISAEKIQSG
jgi:hypothetical protein